MAVRPPALGPLSWLQGRHLGEHGRFRLPRSHRPGRRARTWPLGRPLRRAGGCRVTGPGRCAVKAWLCFPNVPTGQSAPALGAAGVAGPPGTRARSVAPWLSGSVAECPLDRGQGLELRGQGSGLLRSGVRDQPGAGSAPWGAQEAAHRDPLTVSPSSSINTNIEKNRQRPSGAGGEAAPRAQGQQGRRLPVPSGPRGPAPRPWISPVTVRTPACARLAVAAAEPCIRADPRPRPRPRSPRGTPQVWGLNVSNTWSDRSLPGN